MIKSFTDYLKEQQEGIYVGVKYANEDVDKILAYIDRNDISSSLGFDDIHSTIIFSRRYDDIQVLGDLNDKFIFAQPYSLSCFPIQGSDGKHALVMKLKCEWLEQRHKYLMDQYNLTYDFDEYIPHLTLSYDYPYSEPDPILEDVSKMGNIFIKKEYREELDLNKYN